MYQWRLGIYTLFGIILVLGCLIVIWRTYTLFFSPQALALKHHTADSMGDTSDMRATLSERKTDQLISIASTTVFHDFLFRDTHAESGVTFVGKFVKIPKGIKSEYGHGMGMVAADVNNDGLMDLLFLNEVGGNQLFKNMGGKTFTDSTATAGIAMKESINIGAAFGDIDNNGTEDLIVSTIRSGLHIFKNVGNGHFMDISDEAGISNVPGNLSGILLFDYNNDGLLDIFVTSLGGWTTDRKSPDGYYIPFANMGNIYKYPERIESQHLFENRGKNIFKEVTNEVGLGAVSAWAGDAAFNDLNQDGYPDLFLLDMFGKSILLENEQGKRFVDKTATYFASTPIGAMGVKFFDFDNNGFADLYVTSMHSDMTYERPWTEEKEKSHGPMNIYGGIHGNGFYVNAGTAPLKEISDYISAETYWPWGISLGDVNADGYQDVFITGGMGFIWRYGINSMLLNDSGKRFVDSEFALGIEPRVGGAYETLRSDGIHNALSSRSSVIFDLDNDGDLDIVTSEIGSPPQVLMSNLAQKENIHFLKVRLRGTQSNRDGIGARVVIHTGSMSYTQFNDGKSGYLGQSALPLYFGLGTAVRADRIDVYWPSGTRTSLTDKIPVNGIMEIRE